MSKNSLMSNFLGREPGTDMFRSLQDEIDRVFNRFQDFTPGSTRQALLSGNGMMTLQPKIDISETESEIQVEAELPGVELADVEVSVVNEMLVIEGRKSTESEKKEKNYHLVERSQGQFMRRIPLGFDVDTDKVEAKFNNGVLSVTIQKPEEQVKKTRKIEVKKESASA
ncbi:MAG: Hsp20/alpha crystallin family protein [Rhodothermales bacterium]|nr:Hsp20/alpha crystallin family protein [Rhodothermales bacterium]